MAAPQRNGECGLWGQPAGPRGVVTERLVDTRRLGRFRLFRYEFRCWCDGVLPNQCSGGRIADDARRRAGHRPHPARPRAVGCPPDLGRDELGIVDMWNSNSLVAWLLTTSGLDATAVTAANDGGTLSWASGLVAAADLGPGPNQAT